MAMQVPRRLLQAAADHMGPAPSPQPMQLETQVVVILAALLAALVCVVGLALVARCAWLRRYSWGLPPEEVPAPPPAAATAQDKGLSRNALLSLPRLSFQPGADGYDDCPICLAEFAGGDEVRVLPQCGHRFHVACVDPWLVSHSSCPSCRLVLDPGAGGAAPTCDKCGATYAGRESPAAASGPGEAARASPAPQEEAGGGGGRQGR